MLDYCPHCGDELHDADNYCPHCGEELDGHGWKDRVENVRGFLGDTAADLIAGERDLDEIEIDRNTLIAAATISIAAVVLFAILVWPDSPENAADVEQLQARGVQVAGLDLTSENGVVGTVELQLHNPNTEDAVVEQVTYELYIDGNRAGEGRTDGQYLVPNSSTGNISVSLNIEAVPSLGSIGSPAWNQLVDQANQTLVNGRLNATFKNRALTTAFSRTVPS